MAKYEISAKIYEGQFMETSEGERFIDGMYGDYCPCLSVVVNDLEQAKRMYESLSVHEYDGFIGMYLRYKYALRDCNALDLDYPLVLHMDLDLDELDENGDMTDWVDGSKLLVLYEHGHEKCNY